MTSLHNMLLNDTVPTNKLGSFCYLLALIYSKKGWYKDSFEVLDLLNYPLRHIIQAAETTAIENVVVLHLAREKTVMGFVTVPQEYSHEVLRLLVWNFVQTQQYPKALQVLDILLDPSKLPSPRFLASLNYLRGVLYEHCGDPLKIIKAHPESLDTLPSMVERKKALIQVGKKQRSRGMLQVSTESKRQLGSQSEPLSPVTVAMMRAGERLPSDSTSAPQILGRRTHSSTPSERMEEGLKGAQQNFAKAAEFSLVANDQLRLAKARCKYVSVYLTSVFLPAVFTHPGERINIDAQEATLRKMLDHAQNGYNFALSTLHLGLILGGCLNLAELNFLLRKESLALAYFLECRDLFFGVYMNNSDFLLAEKASLSSLKKCLTTLKRMARLILALGSQVANDNIFILDAVVKLELAVKAGADRIPPEGTDPLYSLSLAAAQPVSPATVKSLGKTGGEKAKGQSSTAQREASGRTRIWNIFPKKETLPPLSSEDHSAVPKTHLRRNRVSLRNQDSETARSRLLDRLWNYHRRMRANFRRFTKGELTEVVTYEANDILLKKIRRLAKALRNPTLSLFPPSGDAPTSEFSTPSSLSTLKLSGDDHLDHLSAAMGATLKRGAQEDSLAEFGASVLAKAETLDVLSGKGSIRTCDVTTTPVGDQKLASYQDMLKANASISRVAYVLDYDDHVLQYVPKTGFVSANRIPKMSPLDATAIPLDSICVKVVLNQNVGTSAIFRVLPTITLAQLEQYLIGMNSPKSRRTSLDVKTSSDNIDKSISPVEIPQNFNKEFQATVYGVKYFSTDDEVADPNEKYFPHFVSVGSFHPSSQPLCQ